MFIAAPPDSAETQKVYASTEKSQGFVMNLSRAWAWRPDVFEGFGQLRAQLSGQSTLSKRELAVMVCAGASELGDSYCSLAWGNTLAKEASPAAAAAVISNQPAADLNAREQALARWARKVVADPNATTAADVEELRQAGFNDREVFEATLFIAFRQAFSTVNDALGLNPDRQLAQQVPAEVSAAVNFGRPVAA